MKGLFKKIVQSFYWVLYNKFITNIPTWTLRKFFYRLVGLKIGENSRIGIGTVIVNPWDIVIGKNTVINENTYIDGRGGLIIGNYVSISIYSKILTATHDVNSDNFDYVKKKTIIENNVWIGIGACLLPGSYLTVGSVIGAMSVFVGKTDENDIYVGNPSNFLKKREITNEFNFSSINFFK